MKASYFYLAVICVMTSFSATSTAQDSLPLTVAEKSNYKSTSTSAEVEAFVDACTEQANQVTKFVFGKTVEGRDLVGVTIAKPKYEPGQQDNRVKVLVLGNIHSGECAGKEALLAMLRELTKSPDHPWLKNTIIVMVPNYSADSNDRMGKNNRPGQVGPENGMGRRENAQDLDLNRDFMKLDSPEARALVGLIDKVDPHLFINCHTTNGSEHQYALTYDIPHNPSCPAEIRDFLRQKMMPEITARMEADGLFTFYYGNFNRGNTKWTTFGHEPRYSTEYVGLRGRLTILSEAYSYISYEERIKATERFVTNIIDYVSENKQTIIDLLDSIDKELIAAARQQPERITMSLAAKVTEFEEICKLKGYKDGQPHEFECVFVGKYESTKQTPLPFAYLIPGDQIRVVDRLLMHGIDVHQLSADNTLSVEVDTVKGLDRAERAFQTHKMVRVEANRASEQRTFPAGTYVVRTAQPLGRLASYLLESESDDGLAFWNFFDETLQVDNEYPVFRLPAPASLGLKKVTEVKPANLLSLASIDGKHQLLADYPKAPKWQGKTNQIEATSWGRTLLIDAESASFTGIVAAPIGKAELVSLFVDSGDVEKELADSLAAAAPVISDDQLTMIVSHEGHTNVVRFEKDENGTVVNSTFKMIGSPDDPAELINFNHDESKVVYSTKQKLNFLDLNDWVEKSVDADSDSTFIGKLDWVYQEELYGRGNFQGYWLSPTGPNVAYLELDEAPVYPYTVIDHIPIRGESEITNYPKSGDPLPTVKLAVANTTTGESNYVDLSQYDGTEILISRISWTADGQQILVQVQNREQTWLDLIATDADGKYPRKMFRDATPAWIESPGDPSFLADGSFVWRSPRTGYSHLYHYTAEGELIGPLTEGEWEVRSFIGLDPAKEFAYFTATKESPLSIHAYRINLADGKIEKLTQEPGTHSIEFSHDFAYFIDDYSTIDAPSRYRLYKNDGTFLREFNAAADDRLNYVNFSEPEFLSVPSGNEQPMDAMIIRPPNFDPSQKYPVLIHIYAGPQAPRVRDRWGGDWYLWHQMLAQQGYVIWMCDNQSASFRSIKHVWPIHKNFAENELNDIERGVAWLKEQDWVDADRIGIWGWSYGGYMTAYALTHSNSFKMGIAGAPVTDWKNYDAVYTERYMDTPQHNPEGYEKTSVLPAAKDLHGDLLIIHGTTDDNVHLSNTLQLVYELQKAGKQFELMMYPKSRHSVRDKEQLGHLRKLMTDFVKENL